MASYRVLDLEAVVDDRYWTRSQPLYDFTPEGLREREVFPPPHAWRVVAIAVAHLSGDDGRWYALEDWAYKSSWGYGEGADEAEAGLLRWFSALQEAEFSQLAHPRG